MIEKKHVERHSGGGRRELNVTQSWQKFSATGENHQEEPGKVLPDKRASETMIRSMGFILSTMESFGEF